MEVRKMAMIIDIKKGTSLTGIKSSYTGKIPYRIENYDPVSIPKASTITKTTTNSTGLNKTNVNASLPTKVIEAFTDPYGITGAYVGYTTDFWNIVAGSRENKVKAVGQYIPATVETTSPSGLKSSKTVTTLLTEQINQQKTTPEGKQFWESTTLAGTDIATPKIEFPDILGTLGDIGKWVLIGGALLLGFILLKDKK